MLFCQDGHCSCLNIALMAGLDTLVTGNMIVLPE